MDDLIGTLRFCAGMAQHGEMTRLRPETRKMIDAAADEIERLRKEVNIYKETCVHTRRTQYREWVKAQLES